MFLKYFMLILFIVFVLSGVYNNQSSHLYSNLFKFKNNTNKSLCKQSLQRDVLVL